MSDNELEKTQHAFKQWRMQKRAGEEIPDALWELVHALMISKHYKPSMIGRALGLSSKQLRQKFPMHYPCRPETVKSTDIAAKQLAKSPKLTTTTPSSLTKTASKQSSTFVEAPLTSMLAAQTTSVPTLTLQRPNGMQLTLTTPPDVLFDKMLTAFMREG